MCCGEPIYNRRQAIGTGLRMIGGVAAALSLSKLMAQMPAPSPPDGSHYTPLAETDPNAFVFSRVKYQSLMQVEDQWDTRPEADEALIAYAKKATNIQFSNRSWTERVVSIDDPDTIYKLPFLFMTGESRFELSDKQAETLAEFFRRGGFLYGDDCVVAQTSDYFYQSVIREFPKALPGCKFEEIPPNHLIYHCFYDFPGQAPYYTGTRHPDMGMFYKGRLVSFVTSVDVHCGWQPQMYQGKETTEACWRFGTNILVYALTH